jgi:Ca-activated chloride channel homolog
MFWNKNISGLEYWFIAIFLTIYLIYFLKIIYISMKMKVSARASFLKFLPRALAFALLIISLMEPTFGNFDYFSKINASNKIIYFVVDVSKSMDAKDIAPSRLEKSKNEIKKIVNLFPSARFGIIAFASEAVLHTPLTSDKEIIKMMTSTLNSNYLNETGTNLYDALQMSLDKITSFQYYNGSSTAIILFTDGEDFADLNENILNDFKRKHTNLFVVGMGTQRGTNIIGKDGNFLKTSNGEIITTKIQVDYLRTLANKTNGKYFEYNANNSPLADISKSIESLKGIKSSASINAANAGNKYHYPLFIAIFIICLDFLFTIRIFKF